MRKREGWLKRKIPFTSMMRRRFISIVAILMLLTSNIGFLPNVHAANLSSLPNGILVHGEPLTTDERTSVSDTAGHVSGTGIVPGLSDPSQSFTKGSTEESNASIVEKEQAFAPAGSVSGNTDATPYVLGVSGLKEGISDKDDLNLVDIDLSYIEELEASTVSGAVYKGAFGEKISSQGEVKQDSVAANVYAQESFPIRNKGGHFTAGFSRRAGSDLFRFSLQDASLTLSPIDSASVSGKVYKNSISYEEIYPETDLRYMVEPFSLKEEIVVKRYTGQRDFFFQLSVQNAVYREMLDSTIVFSNPDSDQPLFYMPKSFAVDSEGNRCDSVSMEFQEGGLLLVSIDEDWLESAVYPIIIDTTINLFDAAFSRSSVAYKQDGTQVASSIPRYELGKFNQGIMIEEGTTNLLTANQSSVETDTTGFSALNSATLSRDTTEGWHGSASLKVVTLGSVSYEGVGVAYTTSTHGSYAGQIHIKGSAGVRILVWVRMSYSDAPYTEGAHTLITCTGAWQLVTLPSIATDTLKTLTRVEVFARTRDTVATTFYIDGLQLEQKPYATSWTLGGTTRASETLTIPTAGVFQKGNWAVELTYIPKDVVMNSNYPRLFHCGIDTNNYYDIAITPDGRIYGEVRSEGTNYALFSSPIVVGTAYSIMFSGDGTRIRLCINGLEYSRVYVEPIGTLLSSMNIGSSSSKQCNGIIDDLRISNRARTLAEHQSAYQSNQPLPVDASTTCKLSFDSTLHANPTINLFDATFSRSSVAYKQDGTQVASGIPRYELGKFNQGIMIEEGTTNLLTANQSSVETDTTGFSAFNSATLSRDTTERWHGSASLKVVTPGSVSYEGVGVAYTTSTHGSYVGQTHIKGSAGVRIGVWVRMSYSDAPYTEGAHTLITCTGAWQPVTLPSIATDTLKTLTRVQVFARTKDTVATTFYIDGLQLEQKPYATSWTLGGTTRASETLTIPTAGVFQKGNWAVELTYISKIVAYSNYPRLFHCGIDANNYYDIAITPDGRIYGEVRSEGTNYALFSSPIVVGTAYSIMFSGDGTCIRLCINGLEYSRLYVEPIGTLLSSVNIGSSSSKQCNGIIDDLRISNRARTLAEHQSAYQSNQPLAVDTSTTCKLNFDGSLDAIGVGPTPTRFIYDYNNRLDYIEMPSGGVIDYQYDANGNLIRRTIH